MTEGDPYRLLSILNDAQSVNFVLQAPKFGKVVPEVQIDIVERRIKQIILRTYRTIFFEAFVSIGGGRSSAAIPQQWINLFRSKGVVFEVGRCRRLLWAKSLNAAFRGTVSFFRLLFIARTRSIASTDYVVFHDLHNSNLPQPENTGSYDVISWYKNAGLENSGSTMIVIESTTVTPRVVGEGLRVTRDVFPGQRFLKNKIRYFLGGVSAICRAFYGLMFGNIVQALLLRDIIEAIYISLVPKDKLARQYFFHNSTFQKPIWTEIVEERGSKVTCYYYSTNMEPMGLSGKEPPDPIGVGVQSWNDYFVWNHKQEMFLRKFRPDAVYKKVGYINFEDDGNEVVIDFGGFKIAVFYVSPLRPLSCVERGRPLHSEYYSPYYFLKFVMDLKLLAESEPAARLFFKGKRGHQKSRVNFQIRALLNKGSCQTTKHMEEISPSISAARLITTCDAVISMPYSSTGVLGKMMGKPSVYYDSSACINMTTKSDVPLITTFVDLREWLSDKMDQSSS